MLPADTFTSGSRPSPQNPSGPGNDGGPLQSRIPCEQELRLVKCISIILCFHVVFTNSLRLLHKERKGFSKDSAMFECIFVRCAAFLEVAKQHHDWTGQTKAIMVLMERLLHTSVVAHAWRLGTAFSSPRRTAKQRELVSWILRV